LDLLRNPQDRLIIEDRSLIGTRIPDIIIVPTFTPITTPTAAFPLTLAVPQAAHYS
jgi:hypothetical protein